MSDERPLAKDLAGDFAIPSYPNQTEFEKPRGINQIEVRRECTSVHVSGLAEPLVKARLSVLRAVADAGVSIDFLKMSPDGLSFVIHDSSTQAVADALNALKVNYELHEDRVIFLAHAVNMRDEEGLIARIVSEAIASGAIIDHLGDMHDRVLIVTDSAGADMMSTRIRTSMMEAVS